MADNSALIFEIGTQTFRADKLNAFKQLHIVRRLAPIIAKLGCIDEVMTQLAVATSANASDDRPLDIKAMATAIGPMLEVFGAMDDKDVEYILNACLDVTLIKQASGTWSRVRTNGVVMFDNLDLATLVQIAWKVIQANLLGF